MGKYFSVTCKTRGGGGDNDDDDNDDDDGHLLKC